MARSREGVEMITALDEILTYLATECALTPAISCSEQTARKQGAYEALNDIKEIMAASRRGRD